MVSPVTIVTGLFYLARGKWNYSGFPPNYDRYLAWSENSLSLDANFVIYCDSYYREHIEKTRRKYDPDLQKTKIHTVELKNLGFYQRYFFDLACLMSSPQFTSRRCSTGAEMYYPLYNIVQYNKIDLLLHVKCDNPFNSTHLMWMDIGATRDNLDKYKGVQFPVNQRYMNDKIVHFSHNPTFKIDNKRDYYQSQIRNIQGGYFMIPCDKVEKYNQLIHEEFSSIIREGIVGSDEKCYDSIYLRNQDMIELVHAGWFEFYPILLKNS